MSPTYDKRLLLKSAYNYAQSSQWDKALDEYRRISKLFPDDANVYSMIADLLMKKNDPAGAMGSHLEAARQFKLLGNDDKELASLRKAQRVQSGNSEVASRLDSFFQRAIAKASQSLAAGKLQEAEDLATKLLDADPGHLQANRLIDDVRAKKLQAEASQAFQEEERLAVTQAPAVDATKEVMLRLRDTADRYLKAEDYDNAVETLLIMLKIDPGKHEVDPGAAGPGPGAAEEEAAGPGGVAGHPGRPIPSAWTTSRNRSSRPRTWRNGPSRSRPCASAWPPSWRPPKRQLRPSLAIIERAPCGKSARAEARRLRRPGPCPRSSSSDESRLRALEGGEAPPGEGAPLKDERDEAQEREKQVQAEVRRESELLRHVAMEMERMELEAKAKSLALPRKSRPKLGIRAPPAAGAAGPRRRQRSSTRPRRPCANSSRT